MVIIGAHLTGYFWTSLEMIGASLTGYYKASSNFYLAIELHVNICSVSICHLGN